MDFLLSWSPYSLIALGFCSQYTNQVTQKKQDVFPTVLGAGKSQVKVLEPQCSEHLLFILALSSCVVTQMKGQDTSLGIKT